MLFSFFEGGRSVCPGAALDYVLARLVGESRMVCDAHLLILQIHMNSFGAGQVKVMLLFSVWHGIGRLSMW
jgi:hypothetical protein